MTFSKLQCLAVGSFLFCMVSCEKVIDLQLDGSSRKYVIEGSISNSSSHLPTVLLSQTKDFSDENLFNGINGATVTVQVNGDSVYTLSETSPGVYQSFIFTGIPGKNYKLTVKVQGFEFTATSQMPAQPVPLDTLTVDDFAFGGSSTKTIVPDYLDPPGKGNCYRFVEYSNGLQVKKVMVQNDDLSDGLRVTRPLINTDGELKTGDTVKVDMQCIDPFVYKYWYSLDQAATGANQSATPANPVSNITGGAIGYFSAYSVTGKTIVVP